MNIDYLGWSLDFSTIQMLFTLKLVSASFNISDGYRLKNKIDLNTSIYNI